MNYNLIKTLILRHILSFVCLWVFFISLQAFGQVTEDSEVYYAGFKTVKLTDSTRIYKPYSGLSDRLHHRPVELDIWYPSTRKGSKNLVFNDFFIALEQRANQYQVGKNYDGLTEELAQFYAIQSGLEATAGTELLQASTNSYMNLIPANESFPLIFYLAGMNGMGFENFKILERLAEKGFIVVSIWSVGRYPGDMTNQKEDMLEQVFDAEFALKYLKEQKEFLMNYQNAGILGCSWGGMSAAVFADRNPAFTSLVSLDGSEISYFGESDEDDTYLREIFLSDLLRPEYSKINYMYLESGNKLETATPTEEFNFFKNLGSDEKYYFRFLQSRHEDFTCIPSTLQASPEGIELHKRISDLTVLFFEKYQKNSDDFKSVYGELASSEFISTIPYEMESKGTGDTMVQGEIRDANTGNPIAYVNMGLVNKEIGTVSNESGKFEFQIKQGMEGDQIRVSAIGYEAKTVTVQELLLKKNIRIDLVEDINELHEVVISTRGLKKKNLGNKTSSKFVSTGFGYDQLGSEIGIEIAVRKQPVYVDTFNFNISHNRLSAKALFRLNIYETDRDKPTKNIMTENIIIPVDAKQTGLISVDLTGYNIVLRDNVIATLEWVKNEGVNNKGEAIYFSLGVFNSGTWVRRSREGQFKKHGNMGVGFNFDVRN